LFPSTSPGTLGKVQWGEKIQELSARKEQRRTSKVRDVYVKNTRTEPPNVQQKT